MATQAQSALLSAFQLGGLEAVVAMCMDPEREYSIGELMCREEWLRR